MHGTNRKEKNLYIKLFFRLDAKVKNKIIEFHGRSHKINSILKNK